MAHFTLTQVLRIRHLAAAALAGSFAVACSGGHETPRDVRLENPDLSVGVYAECQLPSALQPMVNKFTSALNAEGISLSTEFIFVYDYDLASGAQTFQALVGGGAAAKLIKLAGPSGESAFSGGGGGGLVSATVPVDWDGTWSQITWGVDAFTGADILTPGVSFGGGSWQTVWSSNSSEIGETGYWGAGGPGEGEGEGAESAGCSGGGIVFTSNSDICVIKGWLHKIFGTDDSSSDDAGSGGSSWDDDSSLPDGGLGSSSSGCGKDAGSNADAGDSGDAGWGEGGWGDSAADAKDWGFGPDASWDDDSGKKSDSGKGGSGGSGGKGGKGGSGGDAGTLSSTCDNTENAAPSP